MVPLFLLYKNISIKNIYLYFEYVHGGIIFL